MSNRDQYLEELEAQFEFLGLNIHLDVIKFGGRWAQTLNGKRISFSISQTLHCNLHTFLCLTFFNQSEEERADAISKLTRFMGYAPFCSYKLSKKAKSPINFEWSLTPESNFTIRKNSNTICNLVKIEEGFVRPIPKELEPFFRITTVSDVIRLQLAIGKDSNAPMNGINASLILPFLRKFYPRIAAEQLDGSLTIINVEKTVSNIEGIVSFALQPLIANRVLSAELATNVIDWFKLRQSPEYNNDMMKTNVHVSEAITKDRIYDLYVTDTKERVILKAVPRIYTIEDISPELLEIFGGDT